MNFRRPILALSKAVYYMCELSIFKTDDYFIHKPVKMIKQVLVFFAVLIFSPFLSIGQSGKVMDDLSLTSKILKMERKFAIYLPPGYETSERSYPVLYLLHGGGDDQTGWVQFGEVLNITDKAIREARDYLSYFVIGS